MYKYWSKVRVTSWIYEWFEWKISSEKEWKYWITLILNDYTRKLSQLTAIPTLFYVEESSLELIESSKDREIKKISEQLENEIISSLELIQ